MAGHYVVRNVTRPAPEVVSGLRDAGVATVHESAGRTGLVAPAVRPRQDGAVIAGPAVTVSSHPGDNLMIHAAVEMCQEGDVLVVTTTSPSTDGMFGDLLATSLLSRGVVGLVTDAGVRDIAALRTMGFPVWARAVSAQGTVKASPGSVNVPVVCGGQVVRPGDVVIADDDGVMCVPARSAADVLARARSRIAAEEDKRAALGSGVLGVDMYGLRELLSRLGVDYVDDLPEEER
ncbi:4-carboxy-4-hydroxy-2-oxoadipate aldolase/oxaloacetate decarboxylase [Streptosporangium sp. NBC_01756]|uniref:4-carboxy-4-hydroxy-2-oxoadipate aldolase/oxaloacetate decarboxylase n=1 Tax=Streptosporangium sp. NBC_01756 TaxID=2975950 RepID=UPI002DD85BA8|nr:4-carboxy-4-hydroxy-2-oxoadipate aldolase/oxaloacetate decarboxylase [Streptosporangium sp. NBC_01756]WSC85948.1 4-carboxy-4-hydroxy-2-oxoadipate aldolase/oxaloacetate decarboxylase [Streptosporangium sp. NBC_01756]